MEFPQNKKKREREKGKQNELLVGLGSEEAFRVQLVISITHKVLGLLKQVSHQDLRDYKLSHTPILNPSRRVLGLVHQDLVTNERKQVI